MGTRRTMEDSHSFIVDFDAIRGQGFFAIFDGHAGKHAAEWCGSHFHEVRSPLLIVYLCGLHICSIFLKQYTHLQIPALQTFLIKPSTRLMSISLACAKLPKAKFIPAVPL